MPEPSCKRDTLVCAQCGCEFEVYRSHRNAGRKFCSKECYLNSLHVIKLDDPDAKKMCRGCNQSKPISDFNTYKKNGKIYLGSKCRACSAIYHREHERDRVHRAGVKPARDNPQCSGYIADLAEQICAHYFEGVMRMPNCNPGYDLICKKGFKIDVKSSCRIKIKSHPNASDQWMFTLKRSKAADYFLCLAFRDRETREPEHIWLIPSETVNHLFVLGIAESRLDKWIKFEKPLDKVLTCCAALSR